ncbi:MAG: 3'-5' exonuclease [Hydrogenobacter thermophilus]|uniref:3'-5' exonuclease n=1 Tax=Hydrogenobacter thermophilus TaxID=940 RepID=UPI0030F90951|nr:3'-5' exonuclease [Hydrogenobacter thermophilus]
MFYYPDFLNRCIRHAYKNIHGEKFYACNWDVDIKAKIKDTTFVVCDIETTGLDLKKDEPIAIGALKVKDLCIDLSQSFYRLIKPQTPPKRSSIEVHGITPSDLDIAKERQEVSKEFLEFSRGSLLVGYFFYIDLVMLKKLLKSFCSVPFVPYSLDVLDLYKSEKHISLDEMLSLFDLPSSSHHSALEDAYMTALVFLKLIKPYENRRLKDLPIRVW